MRGTSAKSCTETSSKFQKMQKKQQNHLVCSQNDTKCFADAAWKPITTWMLKHMRRKVRLFAHDDHDTTKCHHRVTKEICSLSAVRGLNFQITRLMLTMRSSRLLSRSEMRSRLRLVKKQDWPKQPICDQIIQKYTPCPSDAAESTAKSP